MAKWEYRVEILNSGGPRGIAAALNALGLEGWELVGIDSVIFVLKRPII